MSELDNPHTLLATLGGQPQVVTFTLDLLLQRGIPIQEVIVVHPTSYAGLQHSITCLSAEFPGDRYKATGQVIHLRRHVLTHYKQPIDDIVDEQTAYGALNSMDELIRSLKQKRHIIHFSITGGRRLISFLSFSAALLNFGPSDRLWHLHTPEAVQQRARNGVIMHATPEDDIRLIEVPFARLAQPILSRLLSPDPTDARTIMNKQNERESIERHQRCQEVIEHLTPTQCNVLRAIALGAHPQQVAHMLERSIDTIGSHINIVLRECRNAWDMPEKTRLDYHFLQAAFADYFVRDENSVHL